MKDTFKEKNNFYRNNLASLDQNSTNLKLLWLSNKKRA